MKFKATFCCWACYVAVEKIFTFIFLPFFVGFGIQDTGWKKIRIRDKQSGSAKLLAVSGTELQLTCKGNSRDHGDKEIQTTTLGTDCYHTPPFKER